MYLIARYLGPATAQAVARFHLPQWHSEGQAAFKVFNPPTDHGDAAVLTAQRWIAEHAQVANPIEKMADRAYQHPTLARRFKQATGQSRRLRPTGPHRARRNEAWRPEVSRSRRSAGRSDMRTPPRSGACSNALTGLTPASTGTAWHAKARRDPGPLTALG